MIFLILSFKNNYMKLNSNSLSTEDFKTTIIYDFLPVFITFIALIIICYDYVN